MEKTKNAPCGAFLERKDLVIPVRAFFFAFLAEFCKNSFKLFYFIEDFITFCRTFTIKIFIQSIPVNAIIVAETIQLITFYLTTFFRFIFFHLFINLFRNFLIIIVISSFWFFPWIGVSNNCYKFLMVDGNKTMFAESLERCGDAVLIFFKKLVSFFTPFSVNRVIVTIPPSRLISKHFFQVLYRLVVPYIICFVTDRRADFVKLFSGENFGQIVENFLNSTYILLIILILHVGSFLFVVFSFRQLIY